MVFYMDVLKGTKGGTAVLFMAEYDALDGLGHGCGHNLIAATVIIFGCPA